MSRRLEERVPLLSDGEQELPEDDLDDIQVSFQQPKASEHAHQSPTDQETSSPAAGFAAPTGDEEANVQRKKHYSGNEMIVSIFVVQFDIRKGDFHISSTSQMHICRYSYVQ